MTRERDRIIKKMFDAGLKEKLNHLARRYDYATVFELWTRLAKAGCVKAYFCNWRWNQNMTIAEALDCLDDYFIGLEDLLQKRQAPAVAERRGVKNQKIESENR